MVNTPGRFPVRLKRAHLWRCTGAWGGICSVLMCWGRVGGWRGGGGRFWATDREAGTAEGIGHGLEQSEYQGGDGDVVVGGEPAGLTVEVVGDGYGDVSDVSHVVGFLARGGAGRRPPRQPVRRPALLISSVRQRWVMFCKSRDGAGGIFGNRESKTGGWGGRRADRFTRRRFPGPARGGMLSHPSAIRPRKDGAPVHRLVKGGPPCGCEGAGGGWASGCHGQGRSRGLRRY